VFPAIDHDEAFCVAIHAVKIGNRFAALQPMAQGLKAELAQPTPIPHAGSSLRMDNGAQHCRGFLFGNLEKVHPAVTAFRDRCNPRCRLARQQDCGR
jgi:hypothetical protein